MKKRIASIILKHYIISAIVVLIMGIVVGTVIFWLLGELTIMILDIEYEWTIWHGFLAEMFYIMVKDMLTKRYKCSEIKGATND